MNQRLEHNLQAPDAAMLDVPDVAGLEDSLRRSQLSESLTTGSLMTGSADRLPIDEHLLPDPEAGSAEPRRVDLPVIPSMKRWVFLAVTLVCWLVVTSAVSSTLQGGHGAVSIMGWMAEGAVTLALVMLVWRYLWQRFWFYRLQMLVDPRGRLLIRGPLGASIVPGEHARVVVDAVRALDERGESRLLVERFGLAWYVQAGARWLERRHEFWIMDEWDARIVHRMRAFAADLGVPFEQTEREAMSVPLRVRSQQAEDAGVARGIVGQLQVLGRRIGGMGVVFFCRSVSLMTSAAGTGPDRRFVLKTSQELLRRGERLASGVAQFEHEAALWLQIPPHANVVEAYGVQRIDDVPYLVTEYVAAGSLSDLLKTRADAPGVAGAAPPSVERSGGLSATSPASPPAFYGTHGAHGSRRAGRLTAAEAGRVLMQVARALMAARKAVPGLVHGDIKPGNILAASAAADGELLRVKLTDFGLSAVAGLSGNAATLRGGTPGYLAPEAWEREAPLAVAQDVYALGAAVYECLAGHLPFREPDAKSMAAAHRGQTPPPLPADVPAALARRVLQCLAKDPVDRPTLDELAVELAGPADNFDVTARMGESDAIDRAVCLLELRQPAGAIRVLDMVPAAGRGAPWHYWRAVLAAATSSDPGPWLTAARALNPWFTRTMGDPRAHAALPTGIAGPAATTRRESA